MMQNLALFATPMASLAPIRRPDTFIDPVADFGAVGDGVTDNADALMAMRQYMADRWDQHFQIHFPKGHYAYTVNTWLNNVGSFEIFGNGSKFENIKSSGTMVSLRVIDGQHWYNDADHTAVHSFGQIIPAPKARIVRADRGDLQIVLKDSDTEDVLQITDFSKGQRIWLSYFDQQFYGEPPNMRFFEWNEVADIDVSTKTITLKTALKYTYEEEAKEVSHDGGVFGAARVWNLDRGIGVRPTRYAKFQDCELLKNSNADWQGFFFASERLIWDGVTYTGSLWLSSVNKEQLKNCVIFGKAEIDKLIGELTIENCYFSDRIEFASGCQKLTIANCTVHKHINVCAAENYINNNKIITSGEWGAIKLSQISPIHILEAKGNEIISTGGLNHVVNTDVEKSVTADDAQDRTIIVDDTSDNRDIIRLLDIGVLLHRGLEIGKISSILFDNAIRKWRLVTTFPSVGVGDTFRFWSGSEVIAEGNITTGTETYETRDLVHSFRNGPIDIQIPRERAAVYPRIDGYITKIKVQVVHPQKNMSAEFPQPYFRVNMRGATGSHDGIFQIGCAEPGLISFGLDGNVNLGGPGTSIEKEVPPNAFFSTVWFRTFKALRNPGWEGPIEDRPIVRVRIEGRSIW